MSEPHDDRDTRCPRCKGTMKPTFVGELSDKHYECEYCGHLSDVCDASSVAEESTRSWIDENGNRVRETRRVVRSRRDGVEGLPEPPVYSGPFATGGIATGHVILESADPEAVREALRSGFGFEVPEELLDDVVDHLYRDPDPETTFTSTVGRTVESTGFPAAGFGLGVEEVVDVEPAGRHRTLADLGRSIRAQARRSRETAREAGEVRRTGNKKLVVGVVLGALLALALSRLL